MEHDQGINDDQIKFLFKIGIVIAACTVIFMYGWMGYTLYSGYLEDKKVRNGYRVRVYFQALNNSHILHWGAIGDGKEDG